MPDNRQNQSNADSISSNGPSPVLDNIQEGMWKMKIESKDEEKEEGGQSKQYPDRPGEPDCGYYLRTGLCGYGSNCRFNHPSLPAKQTAQNRSELPQREGQPDCGYYLKTGTCKYGSTCKYNHPMDRRGADQVLLNSLGLPMRQDEKACPYYMRTYRCKFGPTCKFNHPQPGSIETALPASGPVAAGTMGSIVPPNGIPYVGAYPAWSLTRSPYLPSSRVPGPQAYMPIVFPPMQGPLGTQTWNGYMGNLNPMPVLGLMGSNMMYNVAKNQAELVTSGQIDLMAMPVSQLPERPDHPECRYFMNTGSCKYGSNCKYHHPKERVAQLATNNLGPHGLPLRPSKSSKITDWIQKPEDVEDKNQQTPDAKVVEESHEPVENAASTASEVFQDQAE